MSRARFRIEGARFVAAALAALPSLVALGPATTFTVGCGPAEPPPQNVTNNNITTNVFVSFTREPEKLPFDPRNARLIQASNQLTKIAGHTIGYQFDAALLPEYRASFEEELIAAIENTARDLDELQRHDPEAFRLMEPKLTKIACTYDAVAQRPKISFDEATGTLAVSVPSHSSELVPRGAVYNGLGDGFEQMLEKRYATRAPAEIPASEHALYFRWVAHIDNHHGRSEDLSTEAGLSNDPRAARILRVTELYPLVTKSDLKKEIADWLLGEGDYFSGAYVQHPQVVRMSPPSSTFHKAEAAWVAWAKKGTATLGDKFRLKVLKLAFVRPFNRDLEPGHRYVSFAFPGLDPMMMADAVFEEWASAGHPAHVGGNDAKTELFQWVACPYETDERGGHSRSPQCDHDYYSYALESEATKARLLQSVLAMNDQVVAENLMRVYVHTSGVEAREARMYFWRGLEPNDGLWTAATNVLAEDIGTTDDGALQDEARRLWKAHPERHGTIAYLLANIDEYGNGKVPWATWVKNGGGAGMGAHDLDRYLSHGRRAIALLSIMWPLLDRGFSRMDVIKPKLDAFMGDELVRYFRQRDPYLLMQDVIQKLCEEHAAADLLKMHAYLADYTSRHPSDEKVYSTLMSDAQACAGKPAGRASSGSQGVHDPKPGTGATGRF